MPPSPQSLSSSEVPDEAQGPVDLESVYRAHARDVARWAARLAGPGQDVEDIVHEVFLVAQRRFPAFRRAGNLRVWLYRTTAFLVIKRRRRERWRRWLGGSADEVAGQLSASGPTPLEDLERRRRQALLYRTLDRMPEKYRTVLILFDVDGLSGQEAAALTGHNLSTLRVWLFRARAMFLEHLRALAPDDKEAIRG